MLLQQMVNILKGAEEIVATLTDVELPEWKCRQQMACIGSPVDTRLDYLEKWWEPVSRTLTFNVFTCLFCPNLCFCFTFRFTTVAEVLQQVREQLQKLQNQKYNSTSASNSPAPLAEIENFTLSLYTKLLSKWDMASCNTDTQTNTHTHTHTVILLTRFAVLLPCSALVVEKQPVMSSSPQRPLILKTGVRFTATVRWGSWKTSQNSTGIVNRGLKLWTVERL